MGHRRTPVVAVLAVLAVAVAGGLLAVAASGRAADAPAAAGPTPATAPVERGSLSATVSVRGTLVHPAGPDGSPLIAVNQASGTYTSLPAVGAAVACGAELYRVDDQPVLLLCGAIPAYRDLQVGDSGNDVRQLHANLHDLGADARAGVSVDPDADTFGAETATALEELQRSTGLAATGAFARTTAVVLPEAVRIAAVIGGLGGAALPGAAVVEATSTGLEVQVALDGSLQASVRAGQRALVTLPTNATTAGTVGRIGTVAEVPAGDGPEGLGSATITAHVHLDDAAAVGELDEAPVRVEIATQGVDDVLSVPLTAIVGRPGGGYAADVVRADGRRDLVPLDLGMVDATAGRVEVRGDVREGDRVVVPAS